VRHELGLLARQVGGEVCREVGGIEKDETVRCLDQRVGGVGELLLSAATYVEAVRMYWGELKKGNLRTLTKLGVAAAAKVKEMLK
jgi:hypothetical protein